MGGISNIGKDKLILDTTDLVNSDNVGAYVRSSDGTLITHTTDGSKEALDVNVVGTSDSGHFAEDSGHTTGDNGQFILAVRNDTDATLVDTDLDYAPLQVDENGRLKVVADLEVLNSAEKAEDSVHVDGDIGNYVLSVRQDTLASSVSTDGDYASFKINARGGLWTVPVGTVADDAGDDENPVKVGGRALDGLLAAVANNDRVDQATDLYRRQWVNKSGNIALAAAAVAVDTTVGGTEIAATPTAGRISIIVQNLGNKEIFLGPTGVTSVNGVALAPRANVSLDLGEDVNLFAIAASGSQDVRYMELA